MEEDVRISIDHPAVPLGFPRDTGNSMPGGRLPLHVGSRVVRARPLHHSTDALQGTQYLLTAAGRRALTDQWGSLMRTGVAGVCTSLNTTVRFLDGAKLYSDCSRDNDLSYYEVGGAKHGKLQTAPSLGGLNSLSLHLNRSGGFRHCVPRDLVSIGEKKQFADLLGALAVLACQACITRITNRTWSITHTHWVTALGRA